MRGRPKSDQKVQVIQIKVRLYESDGDLIAFFASIPPRLRAAMVKQALRSGMIAVASPVNSGDEDLDVLDSLVS